MALRTARALALAFFVSTAPTGCGEPDVSPPSEAARAALERSLESWKSGGAVGTIPGADPPIQVIDSSWTGGKALETYEVVREEPDGDVKRFVVTRKFRDQSAPTEVQYVVFGTDPIFVYADEDYQRLVNMDNNPVPKAQRRGTQRGR